MHFKLLALQLQARGNITSEPNWNSAFQHSEVESGNPKQASYPLNVAPANYVEINPTMKAFDILYLTKIITL